MSLTNKISLTCKDATLLICKEQDKSITLWEKIRMHLHLLFCKVCSLFYKQSNHLHAAVKEMNTEENMETLIVLDEQQKSRLQNIVDEELKR